MGLTAHQIEAKTPKTRIRYLDFLRLVAITAVVLGHWLMAVMVVRGGELAINDLRVTVSWLPYLTWVFQVMPLFFIVGGYVNAGGWRSTQASGGGYIEWLRARVRRLAAPTIVMIGAWLVATPLLITAGFDSELVATAAHVIAIPVWFLAVYLIVLALTPVAVVLHDRYGIAAVVTGIGLAVVVDWAPIPGATFMSFLIVWGTVHQLGLVWRDRTIAGWPLAIVGLGGLIAITSFGPYPLSMVGLPGMGPSNSAPPTVAMIALGLLQLGLAIALREPIEALLRRPRVWATVVRGNMIAMTMYLWHMTALIIVATVMLKLDASFLTIEPMTGAWWLSRPVWLAILGATLVPLLMAFRRFERPPTDRATRSSAMVTIAAAILLSIGFAVAASNGLTAGGAPLGLNPWIVFTMVPAAIALGVVPGRRTFSG